jgi:acyl carrier protein
MTDATTNGAQRPDVRTAVTNAAGAVLGTSDVDGDRSFLEQGGDSLSAIVLADHLGTELGIDVPLELVFDTEDLDALVDELSKQLAKP